MLDACADEVDIPDTELWNTWNHYLSMERKELKEYYNSIKNKENFAKE